MLTNSKENCSGSKAGLSSVIPHLFLGKSARYRQKLSVQFLIEMKRMR